MKEAIITKNLCKNYEDVKALNNINMNIEKNKIYGLIGRNGAGKTTLLKILSDQLLITSGTVSKSTENVFLARESLGPAYEAASRMIVKNYFKIAKNLIPTWDQRYCEYLLKRFELKTETYYNKLSKGMKTMVGIIAGLASKAEITFFDEPYIGLDPVAREIFLEELNKEYLNNPRTIIISTHLIYEFEKLFENVLFLDKGQILIDDEIENIYKKFHILQGFEKSIEDFLINFKVLKKEKMGSYLSCVIEGEINESMILKLKSKNIEISKAGLQDIFVNLTKGENIHEYWN